MKRFAKICTFLLVLCVVFSMASVAYADSTLQYVGGTKEFVYAPDGTDAPDNLFDTFQEVMPGDVLTDTIRIRNDASKAVKIKLYLRSLGAQNDTEAFLSQLKLTVEQKDGGVLFSGPADETGQLTDWVYLGTLYSGGEVTLDLNLEVPITLDNAFQDKDGQIDWELRADEFPVEDSDPKAPQTGDRSNPLLYVILLAVSALVLILVAVMSKRRKKHKK